MRNGARPGGRGCQVLGCEEALPRDKQYYAKHRICVTHSSVSELLLEGQPMRWCFFCRKFEPTSAFTALKRNCTLSLDAHNARRRVSRPQQDTAPKRHKRGGDGNVASRRALTAAREGTKGGGMGQRRQPSQHCGRALVTVPLEGWLDSSLAVPSSGSSPQSGSPATLKAAPSPFTAMAGDRQQHPDAATGLLQGGSTQGSLPAEGLGRGGFSGSSIVVTDYAGGVEEGEVSQLVADQLMGDAELQQELGFMLPSFPSWGQPGLPSLGSLLADPLMPGLSSMELTCSEEGGPGPAPPELPSHFQSWLVSGNEQFEALFSRPGQQRQQGEKGQGAEPLETAGHSAAPLPEGQGGWQKHWTIPLAVKAGAAGSCPCAAEQQQQQHQQEQRALQEQQPCWGGASGQLVERSGAAAVGAVQQPVAAWTASPPAVLQWQQQQQQQQKQQWRPTAGTRAAGQAGPVPSDWAGVRMGLAGLHQQHLVQYQPAEGQHPEWQPQAQQEQQGFVLPSCVPSSISATAPSFGSSSGGALQSPRFPASASLPLLLQPPFQQPCSSLHCATWDAAPAAAPLTARPALPQMLEHSEWESGVGASGTQPLSPPAQQPMAVDAPALPPLPPSPPPLPPQQWQPQQIECAQLARVQSLPSRSSVQDDIVRLSRQAFQLAPEQLPHKLRQELTLWVLQAQAYGTACACTGAVAGAAGVMRGASAVSDASTSGDATAGARRPVIRWP